jgi:uncharacterized SAM-binding protein YcdF (DUF218 family)
VSTAESESVADASTKGFRRRMALKPLWWRRGGWSRVLGVLVCVVTAGLVYYAVSLFQVWSTGRDHYAKRVDAIVVMGAAQYDGRPSPQLQARLDHVVEIFNRGAAPLVIVTGGNRPGDRFTEAGSSREYLIDHGIPENVILAEETGSTSWESLQNVASIARSRGIGTVVLVSDPYHSLRIRLMAEELGLRAHTSSTTTSPVDGWSAVTRHVKEAAGVAVGRIIGFDRVDSLTG